MDDLSSEEAQGHPRTRRRELSEVDPFDNTSYRTTTQDDHDFSGLDALPEDLHLTTSRTSFRRRSSASRLGPMGAAGSSDTTNPGQNEEQGLNQPEFTTPQYNLATKENRIDEEAESDTELDDHAVIPIHADNQFYREDTQRKQSFSTLPSATTRRSSVRRNSSVAGASFTGENADGGPATKVETTKSVRKKRRHAEYIKIGWMFGRVYLIIFIMFFLILSIYWGSWYDRSSHLKRIGYLVVSEEQTVENVPPLITETLFGLLNSSTAHTVGTFHFKSAEIIQKAADHNNTILQQVISEVHRQNYWGAFYIAANTTFDFYTALKTQDTSFNTTCIKLIYENGRKPQSVQNYVVSPMLTMQTAFVKLSSSYIFEPLIGQLSSNEQLALATNASSLISGPWFEFLDNRPVKETVITGPIQIGLIYMLVLSFHQFNFASSTHETIRALVPLRQYLVYHILTSHMAYIWLSLVYSLISIAFGAPYDATFGKSGFLVLWAFTYLLMAALGGLNENAALQIFARDRPLIGFWIVFFMVINLAPVFSPITVTNVFYRYGYAIPMYNGHELLKIVFLNTYKGNMGRCIGILIAWILLANIILPFNLKSVKRYKQKVEAKAKAALEKAHEKGQSSDS
ncbi:Nitrosoguanidine resistance protein SNG1 [Cyberlindnera fabianii]|uniref:Nitrosoguanidine resistance protein SNG1 n=1 Tax=Cyberlindnera fabianii TaxID=36022 RepID=A0A1V2LC22_CYBFA|nr:Nitrosoguanidine resistance protein SNG1 [Cyberlindnera fabianii]